MSSRSINKCNCWWQWERVKERKKARKKPKAGQLSDPSASDKTQLRKEQQDKEKYVEGMWEWDPDTTWRQWRSTSIVVVLLYVCVLVSVFLWVCVCAILVSSLVAAGAPPSCASLLHSIQCMPLPQTVAYFRALDCAWVTASQVELALHPLLYPTFSLASLLCTEKLPSPSCVANQA